MDSQLISGIICVIIGIIGIYCYASSKETLDSKCGVYGAGLQTSYNNRRMEILSISISVLILGVVLLGMKFYGKN